MALKVQESYGEVFIGYTTVHILNGAPVVKAEASPSNGKIPLTVSFSATASDNEGISLYE